MIRVSPPDSFQILRRQIRRLTPGIGQSGPHEDQQFPAPGSECAEQRLRLNHFRGLHRLLQDRPP